MVQRNLQTKMGGGELIEPRCLGSPSVWTRVNFKASPKPLNPFRV